MSKWWRGTPGTKGVVHGKDVNIVMPDSADPDELTAYFSSVKPDSRSHSPVARRGSCRSIWRIDRRSGLQTKTSGHGTTPIIPSGPARTRPARWRPRPAEPKPGAIPARELGPKIDQFLAGNGALVRVNDADGTARSRRSHTTYDLSRPSQCCREKRGLRTNRAYPADGTRVQSSSTS